MSKTKKKFGDRKDGKLIRNLDSMHFITGILYPNRCDNEAYISQRIELDAINEYVKKKNEANDNDFKYTMFHVIVTALTKTVTLRPKLNRFIVNGNFYQRNEVCAAFTIKKQFEDHSEEGLAFLHLTDNDNVDSIHEDIRRQVTSVRGGTTDESTENMDLFNKMPRGLSKFLVRRVMWLDKHGWVPSSFIATDPYYSSVLLSNVGSIKLKSGYHHLTNWGTCSLFCLIGEKKMTPVYNPDGSFEMKETLDLGLTIDERLADGYYYSKSVRLLKYLLEHPDLLDRPLCEEVDYE